jgi:hypothetical protein
MIGIWAAGRRYLEIRPPIPSGIGFMLGYLYRHKNRTDLFVVLGAIPIAPPWHR